MYMHTCIPLSATCMSHNSLVEEGVGGVKHEVRAPFAPLPVHNIEGHLQHEGIISEPHFFVSDKLRVSLMDAGT